MQTGQKTMTYEWAGLIGDSFDLIPVYPWIPFAPILFFALTCISQLIVIRFRETLLDKSTPFKRSIRSIEQNEKPRRIEKESFHAL